MLEDPPCMFLILLVSKSSYLLEVVLSTHGGDGITVIYNTYLH